MMPRSQHGHRQRHRLTDLIKDGIRTELRDADFHPADLAKILSIGGLSSCPGPRGGARRYKRNWRKWKEAGLCLDTR